MTRFEAGVTGSPRDAPEGKWVLGRGIEIPCAYNVYGRIDQKSLMSFHCSRSLIGKNDFVLGEISKDKLYDKRLPFLL